MDANTNYLEKRKTIDLEIELIKRKLENMDMGQKLDKKNYGYAGTCSYIIENLETIIEFLD